MKNKYLITSGYYDIFIRNDLTSLLLYYDHFSQGLFLPKYLSYSYIRKTIHFLLRIFIILIYLSNAYKVKYKTISMEENSLIVIKGKTAWSSTIKLVEENGALKITKQLHSKKLYLREKKFYNQYKNVNSKVKLPKSVFLDKNIVETDFVKGKSLFRLINDGTLNYNQTLNQFSIIKDKLIKTFYGKGRTLVHGDLDCGNIIMKGDDYYIIDYSDAQQGYYYWDLYKLFFSMLASFHYVTYDQILLPKIINNEKLLLLLGLTVNEIQKADNQNVSLLNIDIHQ